MKGTGSPNGPAPASTSGRAGGRTGPPAERRLPAGVGTDVLAVLMGARMMDGAPEVSEACFVAILERDAGEPLRSCARECLLALYLKDGCASVPGIGDRIFSDDSCVRCAAMFGLAVARARKGNAGGAISLLNAFVAEAPGGWRRGEAKLLLAALRESIGAGRVAQLCREAFEESTSARAKALAASKLAERPEWVEPGMAEDLCDAAGAAEGDGARSAMFGRILASWSGSERMRPEALRLIAHMVETGDGDESRRAASEGIERLAASMEANGQGRHN